MSTDVVSDAVRDINSLGSIVMPFGKYQGCWFLDIPIKYLNETVATIASNPLLSRSALDLVMKVREWHFDHCYDFWHSYNTNLSMSDCTKGSSIIDHSLTKD